MSIRTSSELGAAIRAQRRKLGLEQRELAEKIGVSRKWVIELEKGSGGAGIGLILRALRVLKLSLDTVPEPAKPLRRSPNQVDLDAIIAAASRPRR